MGPCCSRGRSAHTIEDQGIDHDWCLIELPEDIQERILEYRPLRQPTRLSGTRSRWVRAILKIRLLKVFRIRWSRTGAWLNLHPRGARTGSPGFVPPEQRAIAARLWATEGRAILQQYSTRQLFANVSAGRTTASRSSKGNSKGGGRTSQPPGGARR